MSAPASVARVATERPSPYLKQSCKHFRHSVDVEFDDERGTVAWEDRTCVLTVSEGELLLRCEAPTPEKLAEMEQYIGSHIERFGQRDGLVVRFEPEASS